MTAAVYRSTPALAIPPTQNTAPVLEFNCLYTHDLRRKQKRWQDGFLRFHTFNKRVMVYDVPRNFVGDTHWQQDEALQEGDEVTLEKGGVMVQVADAVGVTETDVSEIRKKKHKASSSDRAPSSPAPIWPAHSVSSAAAPPQLKHKSLNALLGTPRGKLGKATMPSKSPFDLRNNGRENEDWEEGRSSKRQKIQGGSAWNITRTSRAPGHERKETPPRTRIPDLREVGRKVLQKPPVENVPVRNQQPLKDKEVIDICSQPGDQSQRLATDQTRHEESIPPLPIMVNGVRPSTHTIASRLAATIQHVEARPTSTDGPLDQVFSVNGSAPRSSPTALRARKPRSQSKNANAVSDNSTTHTGDVVRNVAGKIATEKASVRSSRRTVEPMPVNVVRSVSPLEAISVRNPIDSRKRISTQESSSLDADRARDSSATAKRGTTLRLASSAPRRTLLCAEQMKPGRSSQSRPDPMPHTEGNTGEVEERQMKTKNAPKTPRQQLRERLALIEEKRNKVSSSLGEAKDNDHETITVTPELAALQAPTAANEAATSTHSRTAQQHSPPSANQSTAKRPPTRTSTAQTRPSKR
ncbi:hypothetical protein LTR66_002983, partial [Elasticomyces elasticus]